jgi:hypothetical protein
VTPKLHKHNKPQKLKAADITDQQKMHIAIIMLCAWGQRL